MRNKILKSAVEAQLRQDVISGRISFNRNVDDSLLQTCPKTGKIITIKPSKIKSGAVYDLKESKKNNKRKNELICLGLVILYAIACAI
tara:strand:- start:337 stop:600 length:264 start_codon:yes stop_codon:yes gene_type:complete